MPIKPENKRRYPADWKAIRDTRSRCSSLQQIGKPLPLAGRRTQLDVAGSQVDTVSRMVYKSYTDLNSMSPGAKQDGFYPCSIRSCDLIHNSGPGRRHLPFYGLRVK